MAEPIGFRWTTLRVAALYPFELVHVLLNTIIFQIASYAMRSRAPGGAAIVGLIGAGSTALALTRALNLDWPAWAVALTSYVAGGVAAACVFGYFQLVRSELPPRQS